MSPIPTSIAGLTGLEKSEMPFAIYSTLGQAGTWRQALQSKFLGIDTRHLVGNIHFRTSH